MLHLPETQSKFLVLWEGLCGLLVWAADMMRSSELEEKHAEGFMFILMNVGDGKQRSRQEIFLN